MRVVGFLGRVVVGLGVRQARRWEGERGTVRRRGGEGEGKERGGDFVYMGDF